MPLLNKRELEAKAAALQGLTITDADKDAPAFVAKFCQLWPVLEGVLNAVKIFTGRKVDKVIDDLIAIADDVCGTEPSEQAQQELIGKICQIWEKVVPILKIVKFFTGKKVDKVIDDFIALGNLVCDEEDDD